MDKLDGFGRPVVDDGRYYVEDSRSVVGNCMSWWCHDGHGYTCEIDEAGIFAGSRVRSMRDTDVPWPVAATYGASVRHVRRDELRAIVAEEQRDAATKA